MNPHARGRMAAEIALAVCTDSELSVQVGGTTPPNQDRLIEYVTRLVQGVLDGMGLGSEREDK
jgi:hypothetical protein